jgi:zinc transport system substrate-binding protein
VVAAFYPVAWVAQEIGGDAVAVENLTPSGAEPHDLELTPKDVDHIEDAELVVVMGHDFQPAVEQAAKRRKDHTIRLLDELPDLRASDPHVWLDPVRMRAIVDIVARALDDAIPNSRATFDVNAKTLRARVAELDRDYRRGLSSCDRTVIVTAHEAFGYLAARYGLRQEAIAGIAPDQEPDADRLAELADRAKRDGLTTVFTEALVSPRVADTLAREAGIKTETLNPLEGLTATERTARADYLSVMRTNLAKLRSALGCM